MAAAPAPKIELHVHLEGAVRPGALLEIAARNGVSLPASGEAELARLADATTWQDPGAAGGDDR